MYCRNCAEALNDNQAICVKCGVKVGEGSAYCPNCGQEVAEGQEVCLNCGASLKKPEAKLAGQDKVTMIIVCLFLGWLGIHNFMMGETKKGIAKIILCNCCLFGWVFVLIDLINIARDKYVVDANKFI